jgi:hypothetical protein
MSETSINNASEASSSTFSYFTPSTSKLVVMSLCTFGLYNLYWFYKNWLILKNAGKECSPFWRTFFASIFAYSCFKSIYMKDAQIRNKAYKDFPVIFLSVAYFILCATWRLPSQYGLIGFLSFLPIIMVNRAALAINQMQFPGFVSNNKFSKWNWLAIVLGVVIFALAVLGSFVSGREI